MMKIIYKTILMCLITLLEFQNLSSQTWSPITGIAGTVYCATDDNDGFLVGTDAGIFKSVDNGKTFSFFSKNFPSGRVIGLTKTGNNYLAYIHEEGLFLSTDNGNNWIKKMNAYRLAFDDYDNGQKTFARTTNGISVFDAIKDSMYSSSDNGLTWISKYISRSTLNIFPAGDRLFYYNTNINPMKLYYSTDLGNNWIECNSGLIDKPASIVYFKNKYIALTKYIYELNTSNNTWSKINTDTLNYETKYGTYTFWPGFVAVTDNAIVAQTGGNTSLEMAKWSLNDNGWKTHNSGLIHNTKFGQNLNTIFGFQNACLLSREDSFYVSENLGAWNYIKPKNLLGQKIYDYSLIGKTIYSIPWAITNKMIGIPYIGKVHSSDIDQREWTPTLMPDIILEYKNERAFYIDNFQDTIIHFFTSSFSEVKFLNKVNNQWKKINSLDLSNDYPIRQFKYKDTLFIYGSGEKSGLGNVATVISSKYNYSDFNDRSFQLYLGNHGGIAQGMQSLTEHNGKLFGLASVAYAGKSTIFEYQNSGKNGIWWNKKVETINGSTFAAYSLISWDGKLFLGLANEKGVLVSNDNGNSWAAFNSGLTNCTPVYFHSLGDTLIMGAKNGLFLIEKGGSIWKSISGNLPACNPIKMSHDGKYLYMLQTNGGLWIMPRSGQTLSNNKNNITLNKVLVYPNPFNSLINVTIPQLNEGEMAEITITDILGKILHTNTTQNIDNTIDIGHFSKGIYLVNILVNNETVSMKILK